MNESPDSIPPAAPPPRQQPSPLRVAVFVVMLALVVVSLISNARAPESEASKRLDSHYYAFMGNFLTRIMVGLESLEAEGSALPAGPSPDEFAEAAAQNYELALERREDDLDLRIALATVYWHAGLRAEKQMLAQREAGRAEAAQELALEAGELKTKAVSTLRRGLSLHPGDPTITTLVYGLVAQARVRPEWVDDVELRRIAARIAPGHLLMSHLYEDAGMRERAGAELERAHDAGWRTLVKVAITAMAVVVGMLAGLVIWVVALVIRARRPAALVGQTRAPWSVWRAVELFVLWMFLSVVFQTAAALLAPPGEVATLRWVLGLAAVYAAAGIVAIAWFALSAHPGSVSLSDLGWRRIGVPTALGAGIAGYLAAMPVVYPVLAVVNRFLGSEAPSSPVVAIMTSASGIAPRVVLIGLVVVAAPLVEETIFRGVLFAGLRRRMGFGAAAAVSAAVFAGFHLQLVVFLPIAILGVVLAYVYERTGSLWASAVTHAAFNGVAVVALYLLMS